MLLNHHLSILQFHYNVFVQQQHIPENDIFEFKLLLFVVEWGCVLKCFFSSTKLYLITTRLNNGWYLTDSSWVCLVITIIGTERLMCQIRCIPSFHRRHVVVNLKKPGKLFMAVVRLSFQIETIGKDYNTK